LGAGATPKDAALEFQVLLTLFIFIW